MDKYRKIPLNVYLLSIVSFFNDISSEMLYPILPIFITQILGAPVYTIGIIEGFAEGTSALLKSYFGFLSDKWQKKKPFVITGYGLSSLSKILISLAYTWPLVFIGRFVDRLGKGVRTGARDALLLDSASKQNRGLIFGLHRSFDSAGAIIGPLISLYLLQMHPNNIRQILYVAILPSLFGLLLFFFIKDVRKKITNKKVPLTFFTSLKTFPREFRLFLITLGLFSLGNSTDSFLILQTKNLGLSLSAVVLVYIVYNIVYTLLSTPAGILADKLGAKKVFSVGLIIYTLVYIGFAFNKSILFVWILFAIYGAYIALTDGVSKALIGSFITPEKSATAYGVSQMVTSLLTLLASIIGGFLWSLIAPSATFIFGAACAIAAFGFFMLSQKSEN